MNTRIGLVVFASTLGLIVISAIIGSILESAGLLTRQVLGPSGTAAVKLFYLPLWVILGLAAVPLLMKYFCTLQVRIGNEDVLPVKWLIAHERKAVYGFWGLIGDCACPWDKKCRCDAHRRYFNDTLD